MEWLHLRTALFASTCPYPVRSACFLKTPGFHGIKNRVIELFCAFLEIRIVFLFRVQVRIRSFCPLQVSGDQYNMAVIRSADNATCGGAGQGRNVIAAPAGFPTGRAPHLSSPPPACPGPVITVRMMADWQA